MTAKDLDDRTTADRKISIVTLCARDWIAIAVSLTFVLLAGAKFYADMQTALKLIQQEQGYLKRSIEKLETCFERRIESEK